MAKNYYDNAIENINIYYLRCDPRVSPVYYARVFQRNQVLRCDPLAFPIKRSLSLFPRPYFPKWLAVFIKQVLKQVFLNDYR